MLLPKPKLQCRSASPFFLWPSSPILNTQPTTDSPLKLFSSTFTLEKGTDKRGRHFPGMFFEDALRDDIFLLEHAELRNGMMKWERQIKNT